MKFIWIDVLIIILEMADQFVCFLDLRRTVLAFNGLCRYSGWSGSKLWNNIPGFVGCFLIHLYISTDPLWTSFYTFPENENKNIKL